MNEAEVSEIFDFNILSFLAFEKMKATFFRSVKLGFLGKSIMKTEI